MRRTLVPLLATAASVIAGCHRATAPGAPTDGGVAISAQDQAKDREAILKSGLLLVIETEPNDTLESAQKITDTRTVAGELEAVQPATKPDEDWYLIQPTQPKSVSIQLLDAVPGGGQSSDGKFVVEVYDRDHTRIQSRSGSLLHDPIAPELASLTTLRVRDALYVRIAGHPFRYRLHIELTDPDPNTEAEPNDRAVDATPLPFDHPLQASYGSEDDKDYYAVELAPDAGDSNDAGNSISDAGAASPQPPSAAQPTEMLRIEVTATPGVRHSLVILDDAQTPLGTFLSREAGEPLMLRDFALRPGLSRVYLLLESAHGRKKRVATETAAARPYAVTIHREPAPPNLELEPNDTLELATPLIPEPAAPSAATSVHRVGYLSPVGDVDDYRLHLDSPARVHVVLSPLDRVDTELSVVESDPSSAAGKTLLKVNEGGTKEPEVIPSVTLAAGDHFLRVQAALHQVGSKWVRDQEDPDRIYHLDVDLLPDDGSFEREPNDTPANATPILPGQTLSGFAFPAKDLDVYRLDLSAQPVSTGVSFRATGVSKVPLSLELRDGKDANLGELLNSSDPGKPGVDAQFQQKLDPGVYFLVVKPHPASRAAGIPQADAESPYRLSVQIE